MNQNQQINKKRKRDSSDLGEEKHRDVPRSLHGSNTLSSTNEEEEKGDPIIPYKVFQVSGYDYASHLADNSLMNIPSMPQEMHEIYSELMELIRRKVTPMMSYNDRVAYAIVMGLLKDRAFTNSGVTAQKLHLTRGAAIAMMKRSFETLDQIEISAIGPVSMPMANIPQGLTRMDIQLSHQFRIGVLFKPLNPSMSAMLTTLFYTGSLNKTTNLIDSFDLREYAYLRNPELRVPPGDISRQLANMLETFISLDSSNVPIPDIATMQLIEIGERSDMLTDPSLLFYMDIPQICIAWMMLNLKCLVGVICDTNEGIEYRLISMIVPVRASIQIGRPKSGPQNMFSQRDNNDIPLNAGFSI